MSVYDIVTELRRSFNPIVSGATSWLSSLQSSTLFKGPIIPETFDWQHNSRNNLLNVTFIVGQGYSLASTISRDGFQPLSGTLAGMQLLLHNKTGGYPLYDVGFNPRAVFVLREVGRLLTGPLLHHTLPQLMNDIEMLYSNGSWLEQRWGVFRTAGILATLTTCSRSILAAWSSEYFVGASDVALAQSVVTGYLQDEAAANANPESLTVHIARYFWAVRLILMQQVWKWGALQFGAALCGVAAGVAVTYGRRVLAWMAGERWDQGRHGLGWFDLGIQMALGGILVVGYRGGPWGTGGGVGKGAV